MEQASVVERYFKVPHISTISETKRFITAVRSF